MDEFISVDEALEVLFDKADMSYSNKIKRLFQHYNRGKIDFYTELFGRHSRYGVRENQQKSPESIEKLEGFFKLNREECDEYFHELLLLHLGVEFKDNDVEASSNVIDPYDHHQFYESFSIGLVEDMEGQVWKLKDQEPAEYKGIEVHHTYPIHPQVDDLLIKADQVAVLAQASKPQQLSVSESGERLGSKLNHALKRIEVLEVALWILANNRGECVKKSTGKVVGERLKGAIVNHAGQFWTKLDGDGDTKLPVVERTILDYVNKALSDDPKKKIKDYQ
ncbi:MULTISPECIES: hypothetical protein [unclassified Pseudoalteromonas]|uniref:hypothetical protein n=1 Tax=unclassified Pseudoalteromonas TaxID=194690 RepID=UPI002359667C|nr:MULTISPECIES: hypothetical protein [unclassified Pseudoalteromonas]MDC9563916.1 hypothetical protein [Pseudoalteromonas sp. GAB2316C]MDC9568282.1 hypothetical protein [Pseudoalteromonas sp. GABNB9D]MDC9572718.1 hypothetical protein [Pseudoalteromonas sp. GABNS16A]MDC9576868.1 hypothetical protein [Pseudoalteromonas sp. GABNS16E]MDC9584268.1 hypothetical protein [Pseudoalteromonas sp. GABNS16C]